MRHATPLLLTLSSALIAAAIAAPGPQELPRTEIKLAAFDGVPNQGFGGAVSSAGDVNGDDFDDVIVGAPGDGGKEGDGTGAAYIFYGSLADLQPTDETRLEAAGGASGDNFGAGVAGLGDANGDGFDDVAVGAGGAESVHLFYGAVTGIEGSEVALTPSTPAMAAGFGAAVAAAGDVNGDGFADLIVGAPEAGDRGAAFVYLGSDDGIDAATEQTISASDPSFDAAYGAAVAGAGDVDGDGYDDVIVGAPGAGVAYLHYGGATGVSGVSDQILAHPEGAADVSFGASVGGAGDLDGDGYDDLIVGAPTTSGEKDADVGAAWVFAGGADGAGDGAEVPFTDGTASAFFGASVAGVGDVDGDGYGDLLVGAWGVATEQGAAFLYRGSASGLDAASEERIVAWDGGFTDYFGAAVAPAGDVNGDDLTDLLIGAAGDDDRGSEAGAAYVSSSCIQPNAIAWFLDQDQDGFGDETFTTLACARPRGYVPDDGDCDDANGAINPTANDTCGDNIDSDCDGVGDDANDDEDGDGLTASEEAALGSSDCDANDPGDDTGGGDDTAGDTAGGFDSGGDPVERGCGCAAGGVDGVGGLAVLALLGLVAGRRRR